MAIEGPAETSYANGVFQVREEGLFFVQERLQDLSISNIEHVIKHPETQ